MNTNRVLKIPMIELVIVSLVLLTVGGLAILISVAWPLIHVSSGQSPIQADPVEMINTFHSTVNNDNVEAVLALFAEDATINDSGSVFQGKEQIRNWALHSRRMTGLRLTMLHSDLRGDKVTWIDTARNGPEVQHRVYILRWTAVIQNGTIKSLAVSLLPMPDGK